VDPIANVVVKKVKNVLAKTKNAPAKRIANVKKNQNANANAKRLSSLFSFL
jgi:hypothetical protein